MHQMLQQPDVYSSLPAEKTDPSRQARTHIPRVANPNAEFRLNLEIVSY